MTGRTTNRKTGSDINRHCGKPTERRADRQTDRATDQTDQTDRQVDRQTHIQTHRQTTTTEERHEINAREETKSNMITRQETPRNIHV